MRRFSLLAWIVLAALPSRAATNVVTTLADSGPGSLRQAIITANGVGGGNISISVTGTINLASGLPPLNNISIVGPGPNIVSVRGVNVSYTMTNGFRIFEIPQNSICRLEGITIAHGYGVYPGGGSILNSGILTLTMCTLSSNAAVFGGSIYSVGGSITLRQCTLNDNNSWRTSSAAPAANPGIADSAAGGGIYSTATIAAIEGCSFVNNSAWAANGASRGNAPCGSGYSTQGGAATGGAAFFVGSNIFVSNSVFTANSTRGGDGATSFGCGATSAGGGSGGALAVVGSAQIIRCRFFSNQSRGGSGGSEQMGPGSGGGGFRGRNSSSGWYMLFV